MRRVSVTLAGAAAEQLSGAEGVGREVRSDTDMAMAVDLGVTVGAIDALGVSAILAAAAAEHLGGVEVVGREVRSDADMAMAVDLGFTVEAIDALKKRGVTDREIGDLIIKPRTLSHRRANRSKLTVEESDRAARVARAFALAEKTFANRDKADRWLHKNLNSLGGRTPMELIRTDAGARIVENLMARISWGAPA